ncbi:helix-turn-helix domain-containing protein [Paenibacillus sp. Dod16]|uniref:helix-turn-helix domain-containing protein n=1 Tax=Paenibacillus sp. Dod16 TaxID=3416392 RepID=UPI003CF0084D
MNDIGQKIKIIRKLNSLNQVDFAKVIGISQGTLSDIESGKSNPSIETLISLHEKFDVNLNWLIKGQHYRNSKKTNISNREGQNVHAERNFMEKNTFFNNEICILENELFQTTLKNNEDQLLQLFRQLDSRDKNEIISFIEVKLNKK